MKLRFRANSLRVRVNQKEVQKLAAGEALEEQIEFPGNSALTYVLKPCPADDPQAFFVQNSIEIVAPRTLVTEWAQSEEIGLYFALPTGAKPLKIAIEKDMECINGPEDESDPDAFPRAFAEKAC